MAAQNFSVEEYEKIQPVATVAAGGQEVRYAVPNATTLWRVKTLHEKEPETIAWIAEFKPGEVMVDIGANVGMYTIWAAKTRGVTVYAFEPESQNYALLNRNIFYNKLSGQVHAYCLALSDSTAFSELHLSRFEPGGSCHTFDEKLDFRLQSFQPPFSQGCFSTTLDSLIEQKAVPVPQHIKIDVDGIEHKVIAGCLKTLEKPEVRSLLVEINTNLPLHRDIIERMQSLGFGFSKEQTQASIRHSGAFEGVGNHIFRRQPA